MAKVEQVVGHNARAIAEVRSCRTLYISVRSCFILRLDATKEFWAEDNLTWHTFFKKVLSIKKKKSAEEINELNDYKWIGMGKSWH